MNHTELKKSGIDVDSALKRVMGNENLLKRLLGKFLSDQSWNKLTESVEQDSRDNALAASHTLKGICGNLSMDKLFDLFSEQVRLMREENWEKAYSMMPEIKIQYEIVVDAIQTYCV